MAARRTQQSKEDKQKTQVESRQAAGAGKAAAAVPPERPLEAVAARRGTAVSAAPSLALTTKLTRGRTRGGHTVPWDAAPLTANY